VVIESVLVLSPAWILPYPKGITEYETGTARITFENWLLGCS
jgi:hypothetical protein